MRYSRDITADRPDHGELQVRQVDQLRVGMRALLYVSDGIYPVKIVAVGQKLLGPMVIGPKSDKKMLEEDPAQFVIFREGVKNEAFPLENASLADYSIIPYVNERGEPIGWNATNYISRIEEKPQTLTDLRARVATAITRLLGHE